MNTRCNTCEIKIVPINEITNLTKDNIAKSILLQKPIDDFVSFLSENNKSIIVEFNELLNKVSELIIEAHNKHNISDIDIHIEYDVKLKNVTINIVFILTDYDDFNYYYEIANNMSDKISDIIISDDLKNFVFVDFDVMTRKEQTKIITTISDGVVT